MRRIVWGVLFSLFSLSIHAQLNTDRVLSIGRNALYFEDYVLSIQYFNQVIQSKPYLYEPYYFRGIAKVLLEDFKGAEEDCTLALDRNPFVVGVYSCRGYARQQLGDFAGAIADYSKGLEYDPVNNQLWMNRGIAYAQNKEYEKAESEFSHLISRQPNYLPAYLNRSAMNLEKKDTVKALQDIDTVLKMDKNSSRAYGMRALILSKREEFASALLDLNEAIRLDPRNADYYINRGIIRYRLNDLRGTMNDYDKALDLDPSSLIALFNRGLLRSMVGDNNKAIEDFDKVIQLEPTNYIAIYNRALLRTETGDLTGAITDYSTVIKKYTDFVPAYYARSEARKKKNDLRGAEIDYTTAMTLEMNRGKNAPKSTEEAEKSEDDDKVRENSDQSIGKFNRLVVADDDDDSKRNYSSEYRGRVQNRNVSIGLQPAYFFSWYKQENDLRPLSYYIGVVEEINKKKTLNNYLLLTNKDITLTSDQVSERFASIDYYSKRIGVDSTDVSAYMGRAVDLMLIQDLKSALEDCNTLVRIDPDYVPVYMNRALILSKQLEYANAMKQNEEEENAASKLQPFDFANIKGAKSSSPKLNMPMDDFRQANTERRKIISDYSKVIALDPQFVTAYYNRANLYSELKEYQRAIEDYTHAIKLEPEFAEAFFNRGLTRVLAGKDKEGIADLSKAGELGIPEAYNIIKRYSE
jgi:tetratricopeptide (TPR) repeat protein